MLTKMTDADWITVLKVFEASRSRRGDKGRDDKKFLSALHYFAVHNITWRALPAEFGNWNSVWKPFWRLSKAGVFEAFFEALAAMSDTAHLIQMFDSTVVRAHVSAAPDLDVDALGHLEVLGLGRNGADKQRGSHQYRPGCRQGESDLYHVGLLPLGL
jgi:transposase